MIQIIILDLEWNNGSAGENVRLNEILQIGAVRLEKPGAKFSGVFCAYVRPKIHKTYSPAAIELPELETARETGREFPEVFSEFYDWCGGDTDFATWGMEDLHVLAQNVKYWGIEAELPKTVTNLQTAFGLTAGAASSVALSKAIDYCGFPTPFDFHNSLSDAVYTAVICESLSKEAIARSVCPVKPRKKLPKARHMGPFSSLESLLNNRGCRRAVCPECGRLWRLSCWYTGGDGTYFSKFTCPQHGKRFLCLKLKTGAGSRFWCESSVLDATPENVSLYKKAKSAGEFTCRSSRGSRSRRRYYKSSERKETCSTTK